MPATRIDVEAPSGFRLRTVVMSHGWYDLPPFSWDSQAETLRTAFWVRKDPAAVTIRQPTPTRIEAEATSKAKWSIARREELQARVRAILGLDLDLDFNEFYILDGERYARLQPLGFGPFLRCATAFEDAVKTLATTNCNWSLTKLMVSRILDELGARVPGGLKAFPLAEAMAAKDAGFFRDTIRAGYRAESFLQFSQKVTDGRIDPENWPRIDDSDALVKQIRENRGFGRYAAENLCRLWGRFDRLGLDSWCLKTFATLYGPIEGDVETHIREQYARYGKWQGLALWLDLWTGDPKRIERIATEDGADSCDLSTD